MSADSGTTLHATTRYARGRQALHPHGLADSTARVAIYDASQTTLMGLIVTHELQHGGTSALPILA